MAEIKIIYGSTTGNTEAAAEKIAAALGGTAIPVAEADGGLFQADLLILGSSTWGAGDLQDDWIAAEALLDAADLKDRTLALFGLGDQVGFGDTFADAVGILWRKVRSKGARVIGFTRTDGYEFLSSSAAENGCFAGLILDDNNQNDLTDSRIASWCDQLKQEAGLTDEKVAHS